MSTQSTILPIDSSTVAELSRSRNEPDWVAAIRQQGLTLAGQLELPRLEKTRIDRWNIDAYGTYVQPAPIQSFDELPEAARALITGEQTDNLIIQRNSGVVYTNLSADLSAQGVIFMDLESAIQQHGELVKPYFMKAVEADENRLTALHSALWNGGVFLYVPKNVIIEQPLQALFVTDDSAAAFAPHILVIAETNSSVTYVDSVISNDFEEAFVVNSVMEIFVKSGAKVQVASVRNVAGHVTDLSYRRAIIDKDGSMEWIIGEMNSGNAMSDTTSILNGSGATSDAKVICIGTGEQKLNFTTRARHYGRKTSSNMVTRAVMVDQSTAIINGVTKIEKGATGANGQQTERVLMLSPKARGDANPILLIDEDDVMAGHAASVGQVNPEQVHYLMTRGISRREAEKLIIYGFLAPIVNAIPIKQVEEQLQRLIERKLGQ